MATLILLNKPFDVLSQFTDTNGRTTLADYLDLPGVYPAGRLDRDSEGLVLLTDDGKLQHWISSPHAKQPKYYWVQVEGQPQAAALHQLAAGIRLKDGMTAPAQARLVSPPAVWARNPPIRYRAEQSTSWLELIIREGRNRQVRRMTAAIGHPTLRLIRHRIGPWSLGELKPGEWRREVVHLPAEAAPRKQPSRRR